jgi:EAL domain-containing protein (putative c-di-GMP-specific phosphodiesterase class I)
LVKDWPWLLGGALFAGVALGVAVYAFATGGLTINLMALALVALAIGQIMALTRAQLTSGKLDNISEAHAESIAATYKMISDQQRVNAESMNMARNFENFRSETAELNQTMSEGLTMLRQGHEVVAENVRSLLETHRDVQDALSRLPLTKQSNTVLDEAIAREQEWVAHVSDAPAAAPAEEQKAAPVDFESSELGEALSLALEPVVDLYTSNTAHYRMVLGMTNPRGQDVAHDVFVHYADNLGLRSQLDQHVIEQALGLLGQLRQRDPALCIFVPIGAVTLANPEAVAHILGLIQTYPGVGQGIVLDMPHAVLASLSDSSLEGLATVARAGVMISLSQASISGVDLPTLNRLNVRFVGLAAASVGLGFNLSKGLPGFVQSARALRIQAIISHVGDPRHVQGLSKVARYACGPAFANPRKLKRAESEQQTQIYAA